MRRRTVSGSVVGILLVVSALLLVTLPLGCSKSTSGPSISIYMADRNVKAGDAFSVDVRIATNTPCRGAQFRLTFDPVLMECESAVEGGFLQDWAYSKGGSTVVIPQPTIDNGLGHVSTMGIAVMGGGAGGAEGSGVLCTYHFTALADGMAEPTLSDVVLVDESGQAIPDVEVNN
jgi:hypothetical protein